MNVNTDEKSITNHYISPKQTQHISTHANRVIWMRYAYNDHKCRRRRPICFEDLGNSVLQLKRKGEGCILLICEVAPTVLGSASDNAPSCDSAMISAILASYIMIKVQQCSAS